MLARARGTYMRDWAADARLTNSSARTGSGLHDSAADPPDGHAGAPTSHADAGSVDAVGGDQRPGDAGAHAGDHAGADHAISRGD